MPGMGNLWPRKNLCEKLSSKLPQTKLFMPCTMPYIDGNATATPTTKATTCRRRLPLSLSHFLPNWANEYFRTAMCNAMETAVVSLSHRAGTASSSYPTPHPLPLPLSSSHFFLLSLARFGPLGAVRPRH